MTLIVTVLQIVAPVFFMATVGYLWRRSGQEFPTDFVTKLAQRLAIPCLIFVALMQAQITPSALSTIALATLSAFGAVTVLAAIFVRATGLEWRTYMSPIVLGNTGNLGLPLCFFAFGEAGMGYAVVVFALSAITTFSLGVWLVSPQGSLGRVLREPMIWAAGLGALFLLIGWQTPQWLTNSLSLMGDLGIPLMLLMLGVAVSRLTVHDVGRALMVSLVKLAICLPVGIAAAWAFALGPVAGAILILQVSTPVAVTSYILAERYGADADRVAGLVVVSTLLSVITLPLLLGFLI